MITKTYFGAVAATIGLTLAGGSASYAAEQGHKEPKAQNASASANANATKPASPHGPWLGKWKRNAEKSSMPGNGGTSIFTMVPDGDGFRFTMEMTPPSGEPTQMVGRAQFDGLPHPEKGNAMADHNIFTRLSDNSYRIIDIKDGKETIRFDVTISPDGKTRTSVSKSRNAKGEEVTSTGVWDRVE